MTSTKRFSDRMSTRRGFLLGTAAAGASLLPGVAFAQDALSDLLKAPTRGNWDDQFDTRGSSARQVLSNTPIFSSATLQATQSAAYAYQQIASGGGWPMVPEVGPLRIGIDNGAVPVLRQRLTIAGDLAPNAGLSTAFDTYVQGAVKRFQARHGLPADGVVSTETYKAMNVRWSCVSTS